MIGGCGVVGHATLRSVWVESGTWKRREHEKAGSNPASRRLDWRETMSDELREKIAEVISAGGNQNVEEDNLWEVDPYLAASRVMNFLQHNSHLRIGIEAACVKACEEIAKGEHIEDCEHICFELCPSCIAQKALEGE